MNCLKVCMILTMIPVFSGCVSFGGPACEKSEKTFTDTTGLAVQTMRYRPPAAALKTLLILPPTGGETYIDRRYAEKFCAAGYEVILIRSWSGMDEESTDLELHQRLYTRAQQALGTVIDNVQAPFIGLLGTSVGGLFAAVAAHVQPRLDAVFVVAAGISIPEVIVTSDQEAMRDLKMARLARYNFLNEDEYLRALERVFFLDPSTLAATPSGMMYLKKDLGMALALEDTTVPTVTQERLRDLWHPRLVFGYPNGHFWGIVKSWWLDDDDVLAFFDDSARRKTAGK